MKNVIIYTDGACAGNPGSGGWAAILKYGNIEKEIYGGNSETTNNRMELTAVIEALKTIKEPCNIQLYSDSKYVIDSLNRGWVKSWSKNGWKKTNKRPVLNADLWAELLEAAKNHCVYYNWIKGHSFNEYNNRCDEIAVRESKKY